MGLEQPSARERGGMRRENGAGWSAPGYAVAVLAPVAVAALLVPLRDGLERANLALVLVVVVVLAAALGGRGAGALAAIVSVLAFDFFLTEPYLSMEIASADDIESASLLLVIGLVVGEIVVRARRTRGVARDRADELARLAHVSELVATGAPVDDVVRAVETGLVEILVLRDCWFEPEQRPARERDHRVVRPMPRLERSGSVTGAGEWGFVDGGMALPPEVELVVEGQGRRRGRLVLAADARSPVPLEHRAFAVVLADQLGAALAGSAAD
jgi:K+-sensing histidine kinase KdpD